MSDESHIDFLDGPIVPPHPSVEWRNGDWHTIHESPALMWCQRKDWEMPKGSGILAWLAEQPRPDPEEIDRLGQELDAVTDHEQRLHHWDELSTYYLAMRRFAWFEIARERTRRDVPSLAALERYAAEHLQVVRAYEAATALGSGATMRRMINTRAALEIASERLSAAQNRFKGTQP
jgi:hypothetical protein